MFSTPQAEVIASPAQEVNLKLEKGEVVVDSDVAPDRPEAALIVKNSLGKYRLLFWNIKAGNISSLMIPDTITLASIVYHPNGNLVFLMGKEGKKYVILKTALSIWNPAVIYSSNNMLRHLTIAPRPFSWWDDSNKQAYRIFFGFKNKDDKFSVRSITETGEREYAVIDDRPDAIHFSDQPETSPETLIAASSLPVGFHPAGHVMLWEDAKHCFHKALYGEQNWDKTQDAFTKQPVCNGNLAYTPNGAAFLHWQKKVDGVEVVYDDGKASIKVAPHLQFIAPPSSVADGKGLVGVALENGVEVVHYTPIEVPLADVSNAWMFIESPQDRTLFSSNTGLFRTLNDDQLYKFYDSELYHCGGYDGGVPTRPYLVTTDIFWELYNAAFEGLFILSEKQTSLPAFWRFVQKTDSYLQQHKSDTKVARAFAALMAIHEGKASSNPEANRIMAAEKTEISSVTHEKFDFSELKPRGHYGKTEEMKNYFRSFKYLTALGLTQKADGKQDPESISVLKTLPPEILSDIQEWIASYEPFIAPARSDLVWNSEAGTFPEYITAPKAPPQIFPLSWGIDNEILYHTVFRRIPDARMLPSGLDIAAVLGSPVADLILETSGEYKKYPSLKSQIADLKQRLDPKKTADSIGDSLYARWISALSTQWAEDIISPLNVINKDFWQRKRLQTGLASWATLRHATVLVNERVDAECGEAGFESLVVSPPRGYVEPDPHTFAAIADLFDKTIVSVEKNGKKLDNLNSELTKNDEPDAQKNSEKLKEGIIRRLKESSDKVKLFRDIAEKETRNIPLTSKEYEEIFYVGRAAEHNFLVFKSLSSDNFALSNPDPMPKIADVAHDPQSDQKLLAGVGKPTEWDQIVPFYGRKEVVKGAVYSYYEYASPTVLTDKEWMENLDKTQHPDWIAPYFSLTPLSCPAKTP